jgi:hypothetical protein
MGGAMQSKGVSLFQLGFFQAGAVPENNLSLSIGRFQLCCAVTRWRLLKSIQLLNAAQAVA